LSLRAEIEHLCAMFGISLDPTKGQHFLISRKIINLEVKVANLRSDDIVVDIGSGLGYLTEKIAEIAKKVYAIELDEKLIQAMKWRLRERDIIDRIEIIHEDTLKYRFPKDINVVISNPPYYIASKLIIKILKELFVSSSFRVAILILQQDYVKKLLSKPGSRSWGRLSAAFRYFANGKIIEFIPRRYFFPVPEIDSMLIKMWPERKHHEVPFSIFEKTTQIIFSFSTNKTIRSILKQFIKEKMRVSNWKDLINALGREVNLHKRAREITVYEIEKIARFLLDRELIKHEKIQNNS